MKKRLILLLTIIIIFIDTFAQQVKSTQELKFMGKSMDCSMLEMATHLQTKECKIINKIDNSIIMTGTFLGFSDCEFYLLEDHHILWGCGIILPDYYNKSLIKIITDYRYIISQYTQKYGSPRISKSDLEGESNCRFFTEKGTIDVTIKSNESFYDISILYINNIAKNEILKIQQDEL